jgi:hypothetical protein
MFNTLSGLRDKSMCVCERSIPALLKSVWKCELLEFDCLRRLAMRGLHYGQELVSTNRSDTFAQTNHPRQRFCLQSGGGPYNFHGLLLAETTAGVAVSQSSEVDHDRCNLVDVMREALNELNSELVKAGVGSLKPASADDLEQAERSGSLACCWTSMVRARLIPQADSSSLTKEYGPSRMQLPKTEITFQVPTSFHWGTWSLQATGSEILIALIRFTPIPASLQLHSFPTMSLRKTLPWRLLSRIVCRFQMIWKTSYGDSLAGAWLKKPSIAKAGSNISSNFVGLTEDLSLA